MNKLLILLPAPDEMTGELITAGAKKLLEATLREIGATSYNLLTVSTTPARHLNLTNLFSPRGVWWKKCGLTPQFREDITTLPARIAKYNPHTILALGDIPLFALTDEAGISRDNPKKIPLPNGAAKHRGSILDSTLPGQTYKVVVSYDPHLLFRQWSARPIFKRDLRRAWDESATPDSTKPNRTYIVRPTFSQAMEYLTTAIATLDKSPTPVDVSADIETRRRHTACLGICLDLKTAICIPFMETPAPHSYWPLEEEIAITRKIQTLLTHPNICLIGQNWAYDAQYFHADFHYIPPVHFDTMLAQNVAFPGQPKRLDFIASMYASWYRYWKDDGKEWRSTMNEENLWRYNCDDVFYTLECAHVLRQIHQSYNLTPQMQFKQDLWLPVFNMSIRGMRTDVKLREKMRVELTAAIAEREKYVESILGHPFNPRSTPQMKALFLHDLSLTPIISQKTGKVSFDNDTLPGYLFQEPLLDTLITAINEIRQLGTFLNTFVNTDLAHDKRIRGQFNVGGTETARFSCRKDAFGDGHNLMNIPTGNEDE